jgi:hypothetical protein
MCAGTVIINLVRIPAGSQTKPLFLRKQGDKIFKKLLKYEIKVVAKSWQFFESEKKVNNNA